MKPTDMIPIDELSFFQILREYRDKEGQVISLADVILVLGAGFMVLDAMPLGMISKAALPIGLAVAGIGGALLGLVVAGLAMSMGILADDFLRLLREAKGFPALVIPYWMAGLAWAVTIVSSLFLVAVSATSLGPNLVRWSLAVVAMLLVLSLSWTLGLFGSIIRLVGLKIDTMTPKVPD